MYCRTAINTAGLTFRCDDQVVSKLQRTPVVEHQHHPPATSHQPQAPSTSTITKKLPLSIRY
jgi:hypothetical protein